MKSCNNCQAIVINGVPCHETGCIDAHLDLETGYWMHECVLCGDTIYSEYRSMWSCDCRFDCKEPASEELHEYI